MHFYLAIIFSVILSAHAAPSRCSTGKLDLVLVIDVSGSDENRFTANRDAAWEVAKALNIGVDKALIAVIQYSRLAIMKLEFGSSETWEIVNDTIMNVEWTGDVAFSAEAMDLAMIQFRRGRADADRVVLLFSDGNSFNTWQQVSETAERLHYSNSKIFAVTLTGVAYEPELKQYVDWSNGTIVRRRSEFQQLISELQGMTNSRCFAAPPPAHPDMLRPAEGGDEDHFPTPLATTRRPNSPPRQNPPPPPANARPPPPPPPQNTAPQRPPPPPPALPPQQPIQQRPPPPPPPPSHNTMPPRPAVPPQQPPPQQPPQRPPPPPPQAAGGAVDGAAVAGDLTIPGLPERL